MGIILKTEKRRVIPIWRSLEQVSKFANKYSQHFVDDKKSLNADILTTQLKLFNENKNIYRAGDLLSSAHVIGVEKDFKEVAKYVLDNASNNDRLLIKLASSILDIDTVAEVPAECISDDDWGLNSVKHQYYVSKYREYLKLEPKNPLAWVELGRHYVLVGNPDKAHRCINVALSLDSDNRFITRAASRFFHHYAKDKEMPLQIIRKSAFSGTDPWLISAEIAYSSLLGRKSKKLDIGINAFKHRISNPYNYSELASALGTYEFDRGSKSKARQYFKESLICPTDNSLAQAKWIGDKLQGIEFDVDLFHLNVAYEAKAIGTFSDKEYKDSFEYSKKWLCEEPYSSRPVKFGAYVSGIFLNNYEESISLLKRGIKYDPEDLTLQNDLVYSLVRNGQIDDAIKIFNSKLLKAVTNLNSVSDNELKATIVATAGLLHFRDNKAEEGKFFYNLAINLARRNNDEYLVALATVNLIREDFMFYKNYDSIKRDVEYIKEYLKNNNAPDIEILFKEIFPLISSNQAK